jgi:hypothetical protein
VLSGNDVLNVEGQVRLIILMDAAILTAVASPLPDEISQREYHHDWLRSANKARALA